MPRRVRRRRRQFSFRPFLVQRANVCGDSGEAPTARSGHRVAVVEGHVWCVGGYNPNPERPDPVFRETWRYSPGRSSWRCWSALAPPLVASSAAAAAGPLLFVFGGTGSPFGRHCSNQLYALDTTKHNQTFQILPAEGPAPLPQYGQTALYTDGHLYVLGGTDGILYTIDVHRLNLKTLIWDNVFTCTGNRVNEPDARYRHELAFDGENIYVLAGGTSELAFDFINVPIFNIVSLTWTFRKSIGDKEMGHPVARKCHSAVQIEKKNGLHVFVMGGFDNIRMFNDLWRLEIPSLQWTLMRKSVFPHPLYFHSSAVTEEGCMYTFGGIKSKSGDDTRSNTLYKVWLTVPKLSEMCWEALLYHFPSMVHMDSSQLLKCGVPIRFVERVENEFVV